MPECVAHMEQARDKRRIGKLESSDTPENNPTEKQGEIESCIEQQMQEEKVQFRGLRTRQTSTRRSCLEHRR